METKIEDKINLYLWMNGSSGSDFSRFYFFNCVMPESSNAHSGGVVVLAHSEEEAVELIKKHTNNIDIRESKYDDGEEIDTKPIIIPLTKSGVVLYCDGDC